MLLSYLLLSYLFLADRRRKKTKASAVGYVADIVPGATTRVFKSTKDAVDFAANAGFNGGTFQNEVEIVQGGFAISDELANQAGVDTFETTKGDLRKALTTLKRRDGALLYVENPANLTVRLTPKNVLRYYDEEYDPHAKGNYTESDAYYWTLYLIATGTKFHWEDKKTTDDFVTSYGVKSSLFGSRRYNKELSGEKRAYRAILTKRGEQGYYPERLAEDIWQAGGGHADNQDIFNGVLEAVKDAPTPARALDILTDALAHSMRENTFQQYTTSEQYEEVEYTPIENIDEYDDFIFNNNETPF